MACFRLIWKGYLRCGNQSILPNSRPSSPQLHEIMFEVWLRPEKRIRPRRGIPMHTENELHDYLIVAATTCRWLPSNTFARVGSIHQGWWGTHAQKQCDFLCAQPKTQWQTYSTESRSPERAFLTLCEFDEDVICALDQPDPIQIQQTIKNGIKRWGGYTPEA